MSITLSQKGFKIIVAAGVPALLTLAGWNPAGLILAAILAIMFVWLVFLAESISSIA